MRPRISGRGTTTEDFDLRHQAFLDEYARWDRLVDSIGDDTSEPDLTPAQRTAATEAIAYIRSRLGEGWLREVFDGQHPFRDLIWNRAPWTRIRIADLAEALRLVDELPGGNRLVERFRQTDQSSGAVFELDLAATAMRRELQVQLEPPTQPDRKCDMAVSQRVGRLLTTLHVEVQVVQDFGSDARRAMEIGDLLVPITVWTNHRELLGRVVRIPEDSELPELLRVTDAFWKLCESSSEPEHLVVEGLIDVW